jgi:iron complex outermembrane receptor protein
MKNPGHATHGLRFVLFTAPVLAVAPAIAQAQAQAQAPAQAYVLEEIVVTAQKREQNIQDVPVAVTALSADSIVNNRIHGIGDLNAVTPNLTIRPGAGGTRFPQYTMRGLYTYGSALGSDKGVSLYIDDVYVQAASGSLFEFADIEQIEVLRGPQGTLFGRNSTGGAISVRTRKPTGEFGIRQELTTGNYDQFRSKTRLDFPRVGPLSLTASYLRSERNGDTRNLGAGTAWNHGPATGGAKGILTSPKRLGDERVDGVFVAADLDFHEDFDLSYKFDLSDTDFTPPAVGVAYLVTPNTLGYGGVPGNFSTANMFYGLSDPELMTPITTKRPKAVNNWYSTEGTNEIYGHNLTATWRVNDWATLKNVLAYRKMNLYVNNHFDGLGGMYLPGTNLPFLFTVTNGKEINKQWSDELQLNITHDRFDLTAGVIHFQNDQEVSGIAGEYNMMAGAAIMGQGTPLMGTPFVVPANTGYVPPSAKVKSDAFYIQPEIHLNDQVDFVVGYRITRDDKKGKDIIPGSISGVPGQPGYVHITSGSFDPNFSPIRYKDTRDTYLVGFNYKPVDNILTYVKYSTGFISGGQLATIEFAPETAKSYEIGVKSELFDHRLRSNLALFHVDYGLIQQITLGSQTGVPSAANFAQAIIPSADATAYGFEWENTLVAMDGLTLGANVGFTHFKYDEDTVYPGFVIVAGAPGFQNFNRPKWTGNLFAQYDGPQNIAGGYLSLRVDGQFKSEYLMTSDLSPGAGPTAEADPALRKAATSPDQWLVNARLALSDIELRNARIGVSLWGKNVFNNRHISQYVPAGFVGLAIYEQARTYGLDLSVEF